MLEEALSALQETNIFGHFMGSTEKDMTNDVYSDLKDQRVSADESGALAPEAEGCERVSTH